MEKLSDLIEELTEAKMALSEKERENDIAREKYLDGGGYSWGYYGQSYYDAVSEARSRVEEVKEKIDRFGVINL